MKNAFLAAEDADFYQHQGLDYVGMVRAALQERCSPAHARAPPPSPSRPAGTSCSRQERKLRRKIREWILTPRMEQALTKDQILNLYLNQIYFGHNRYGVEEAALYYFGKHAKDPQRRRGGGARRHRAAARAHQPGHQHDPRRRGGRRYVLGQLPKHGLLPAAASTTPS